MDRDKLIKCLRLLTSPHEGEVLAAAARINAILEADEADWSDLLSGAPAPELSQEQMKRLYDAGYAQGMSYARAASAAAGLFVPTGKTRADEIGRRFGEVDRIMDLVLSRRSSPFEAEFAASMKSRLASYGQRAFVSSAQWGVIDRMREKLQREGAL